MQNVGRTVNYGELEKLRINHFFLPTTVGQDNYMHELQKFITGKQCFPSKPHPTFSPFAFYGEMCSSTNKETVPYTCFYIRQLAAVCFEIPLNLFTTALLKPYCRDPAHKVSWPCVKNRLLSPLVFGHTFNHFHFLPCFS